MGRTTTATLACLTESESRGRVLYSVTFVLVLFWSPSSIHFLVASSIHFLVASSIYFLVASSIHFLVASSIHFLVAYEDRI